MSRTVVVIGGGYGGAAVAKALQAEADVVLIDPRDAFVNAAGSLRSLTRPDWAPNMFFHFDTLLTRGTVVRDRAVSVDPGGVTLASGERVEADYLVLATGSSYAYPAKPNADSFSAALDDFRETHKELAGAERVLILGGGPVGLELAGEITEVWPHKQVTIVDPAEQVLPGYEPEMIQDLLPPARRARHPAAAGRRTDRAAAGRARPRGDLHRHHRCRRRDHRRHLVSRPRRARQQRLPRRRPADDAHAAGAGPGHRTLNVRGHDHVYAVGDITDVPEAKRAGWAMRHAEVVAANIAAQLRGEQPSATYQPLPVPMILLPLGSRGGVGQMPTPDGPSVISTETVSAYKGADLFTGRFTEQFGPTAA